MTKSRQQNHLASKGFFTFCPWVESYYQFWSLHSYGNVFVWSLKLLYYRHWMRHQNEPLWDYHLKQPETYRHIGLAQLLINNDYVAMWTKQCPVDWREIFMKQSVSKCFMLCLTFYKSSPSSTLPLVIPEHIWIVNPILYFYCTQCTYT